LNYFPQFGLHFKHSQTALMLAASHGRVESTNLLLKCGADVNIQVMNGFIFNFKNE
jgi:ankyrin repeat protein